MATWKEQLERAFDETGDTFDKMQTTLTKGELVREFNDGFGGSEGTPFTAWGEKYVYFPIVYDGAEWVGWAPRNPSDEVTYHLGGE